jgi:alanine dehydrogenase
MQVCILTRHDLEAVLTMKDTMEAVEDGFRHFSLGETIMPARPVIQLAKQDGVVFVMPCYIPPMNALTTKVLTIYPGNPRKYDLPSTMGLIIVNDPETGKPVSLMDGAFITAMRTGAVSGIATKYLSRSDSSTIAIIGAGYQARTQLIAINEVRQLRQIKVYDEIREFSRRYAKEMSLRLGVDAIVVDGSKDAVRDSDIIVTCSNSKEPVFDGNLINNGSHINAIGAHRRDARELDTTIIKRSKVVVDSREACLSEAGDIIIPIQEGAVTENHIHAELGEIILGRRPSRISKNEITLFKSVGLAIQDTATASRAYVRATQKQAGKIVDI